VFPLENPKAAKLVAGDGPAIVKSFAADVLASHEDWRAEALETAIRDYTTARDMGFGKVAQPLRGALTGSNASPALTEVMEILGKPECLARIAALPDG
jgi:glutamyl-tRNA synthetase